MSSSPMESILKTGTLLFLGIGAAIHFYNILFNPKTIDWIWVTLAFVVFCLLHALMILGYRTALVFFAVGATGGLFFEVLSIRTGFPFGEYHYTDVLGPTVLGVPFIIPLAWFVVIYMTYTIANLVVDQKPIASGGFGKIVWLSLLGGFLTAAYDLALDPWMTLRMKARIMHNEGPYFGEQYRGVLGWLFVSFTMTIIFRLLHRRIGSTPLHPISKPIAAVPVCGYLVWLLLFVGVGYPGAIRLIALFAMGIPVLAALSGLYKWDGTTTSITYPPGQA